MYRSTITNQLLEYRSFVYAASYAYIVVHFITLLYFEYEYNLNNNISH